MVKLPRQLQTIQVALVLARPILRCDFYGGNHSDGFFHATTDFQCAEVNYMWNQGRQQY